MIEERPPTLSASSLPLAVQSGCHADMTASGVTGPRA
jgi:hypothetical protein